jgi:HlyD family secretion protein
VDLGDAQANVNLFERRVPNWKRSSRIPPAGAASSGHPDGRPGARRLRIAAKRRSSPNEEAAARADVAEAEANHAAAQAGPTREERAIADAHVKAAASALGVREGRLDKTVLRAPADGVVTVIVAAVGENVHAGQPVFVIEETGKQWLSFNLREDLLHGLAVGGTVDVVWQGTRVLAPAVVTELVPRGSFATWQAERAVGDHDRNTLRLGLDLRGDPTGFEPGMTVWLNR